MFPPALREKLNGERIDQLEAQGNLGELISTAPLTEREMHILRMRFGVDGRPHTLAEIGAELGLSSERIRQLEVKIIRKLNGRAKRMLAAPVVAALPEAKVKPRCGDAKAAKRPEQQCTDADALIAPHGGFRDLKTFQMGRLVYDLTVRFCSRYIKDGDRTHDQMVQAARSGVQNIAEGSRAGGTSKKMEIKLTNVARASLEELRLDYEDYLRQHGLEQWAPEHPALARFKQLRCSSEDEFAAWVREERQTAGERGTEEHGPARTCTDAARAAPRFDEIAANGVLSLLNVLDYLLKRQVEAQARAFEKDGGFTERLYRTRTKRRGET